MEYQKLKDGTICVEVLTSFGATTQEGTWIINDKERDPASLVIIWPLITEQIKRLYSEGNSDHIDHILVSPAVALHLVFEGVLTEEHFNNVTEAGNLARFNAVTVETSKGQLLIPIVVEQDMLHKRGCDYAIMDNSSSNI